METKASSRLRGRLQFVREIKLNSLLAAWDFPPLTEISNGKLQELLLGKRRNSEVYLRNQQEETPWSSHVCRARGINISQGEVCISPGTPPAVDQGASAGGKHF